MTFPLTGFTFSLMIKPDVIVTWPTNCDYPHWRKMVGERKSAFNKIIIARHEQPGYPDFTDFICTTLNGVVDHNFAVEVVSGADWRDQAINAALQFSDSEWIWFTEQDYMPSDYWFEKLEEGIFDDKEAVGFMDNGRMHPCSLLIKRSLLDRTSKDFAAAPPAYDHFGRIQMDLTSISDKEHNLLLINLESGWGNHFAGYSHNFRLVADGGLPNHRPDEFMSILWDSLRMGMPLDYDYIEIVESALKRYGKQTEI